MQHSELKRIERMQSLRGVYTNEKHNTARLRYKYNKNNGLLKPDATSFQA